MATVPEPEASRPRRLGLRRFDHVCFAVPNAEQALAFYSKLLGSEIVDSSEWPAEGMRVAYLWFPNRQARIEIMEPLGEDSFLHKFLRQRGPGVHHVTFEVEDILQAAAYMKEEMGIELYRDVWSDGEWKQIFVHPKDAFGVLLQFFEWEPGMRPPGFP